MAAVEAKLLQEVQDKVLQNTPLDDVDQYLVYKALGGWGQSPQQPSVAQVQ